MMSAKENLLSRSRQVARRPRRVPRYAGAPLIDSAIRFARIHLRDGLDLVTHLVQRRRPIHPAVESCDTGRVPRPFSISTNTPVRDARDLPRTRVPCRIALGPVTRDFRELLMPSEMRSLSTSMPSTTASTSSPFLKNSTVLDLLGPVEVGDVHEAVDAPSSS
jgi:hypothetical protein